MVRVLYIVSRDKPELYEVLYQQLRRDMEMATVELTFDRRRGKRRQRAETMGVERRVADRRQHDVDDELARLGWARVQIESAGPPEPEEEDEAARPPDLQ